MILWHVYKIIIKREGEGFKTLSEAEDIEDADFPLSEWLNINQKLANESEIEEVGRFGLQDDADFICKQMNKYKSLNHRFGSNIVYYIVENCHISEVKSKIWDFVNIVLQAEK